jgi:predicted nuclease of restriction endonuclease-like (RecB) superfamily
MFLFYVLDFLGITLSFLERDLEDAILRELETFLLHRSFPLALTSI